MRNGTDGFRISGKDASMQQGNLFGLFLATLIGEELGRICDECRGVCATVLGEINGLVVGFLGQPISPEAAFKFETSLADRLREVGRRIVEVVYNHIESDDAESMPQRTEWDGQEYSRKNHQTNNRG